MLLIGNELLSGRTRDANLQYVAGSLGEAGIRMMEARCVRDDPEAVIDAVNALRRSYDYVFSSGGIGPTHDDITTACIAAAFAVPVIRHPEAVQALEHFYRSREAPMNEAHLKMADVPQGAQLLNNNLSGAPGYRLENVFVLPGVPQILRLILQGVIPSLPQGKPIQACTVRAWSGESILAAPLEKLQEQFSQLEIGSYPQRNAQGFFCDLVLTGTSPKLLEKARQRLMECLREAAIPFDALP